MKLHSDTIARSDALGRSSLSVRIAEGLVRSAATGTDGFAAGVTGKWGSGKSTLLSFLRRDINDACEKENVKHLIIEFNPWMFADTENIRVAILKRLAANLAGRPRRWKRLLLRHSDKLEYFEVAHAGLGKVGRSIGTLIRGYLDTSNTLALKKKIDELLVSTGKKIFVLIDDIDRLAPKQIFDVFQVLKATANFKNVFYIIAFDREAVETAIETQFAGYGSKYLDKIVQADFLLPEVPDEKIELMLFDGLDRLFELHGIEYSSAELSSVWLHRGLHLYFSTVRDVYRYLNSIQFSLPMIHKDVDVTDFLTLEAIRIHDFIAYQVIHDEYNKNDYYFGATVKMGSEKNLELFGNETTKKLVKYLFPNDVLTGLSNSHNKRLYDPKNFARYFTLQIPSRDVSELEFERFMGASANRFNLLKDIFSLGRLDNLLIRLNDSELHKNYQAWNFNLVEELFRFFNLYSEQIEKPHRYADAMINLLHQKKGEENFYFNSFVELLTEDIRDREDARTYFLHFMVQSKENDNGFPGRREEFKTFYLARFDAILSAYRKYLTELRSYYLRETIQRQESYYTVLFIYDVSLQFPTEYFNWARDAVRREGNVLFFLKGMLMLDVKGEAGRVNLETLYVLLPGEELPVYFAKTLKEMDISLFTERQRQWRDFALEYFKDLEGSTRV